VIADEDRAAVVALLRRIGLDAPGLADRLESDGPASALADTLGATTSLLPEDPAPLLIAARAEITRWVAGGLRLMTVRDAEYPEALRAVHDRPPLLFVAGDPSLVSARPGIAVVGSRHPSDAGRVLAARFAAELVAADLVVVSGLAAGIDATAHRAALAAGGRTVAVIATGLEHAYPPENAQLQAELVRDQAVVSSFWPDAGPSAGRFRARNGVMSGLARGTVIIEATPRSGTRVQARLALAHGRPVFLLPALLDQSWARTLSRRPGVHVVESAAEVIAVVRATTDPLTGLAG
jgi:DNA processing protein